MTNLSMVQRRSKAVVHKWDVTKAKDRYGWDINYPWRVQYKISFCTYSPEKYFRTWREAMKHVNYCIKHQTWTMT